MCAYQWSIDPLTVCVTLLVAVVVSSVILYVSLGKMRYFSLHTMFFLPVLLLALVYILLWPVSNLMQVVIVQSIGVETQGVVLEQGRSPSARSLYPYYVHYAYDIPLGVGGSCFIEKRYVAIPANQVSEFQVGTRPSVRYLPYNPHVSVLTSDLEIAWETIGWFALFLGVGLVAGVLKHVLSFTGTRGKIARPIPPSRDVQRLLTLNDRLRRSDERSADHRPKREE